MPNSRWTQTHAPVYFADPIVTPGVWRGRSDSTHKLCGHRRRAPANNIEGYVSAGNARDIWYITGLGGIVSTAALAVSALHTDRGVCNFDLAISVLHRRRVAVEEQILSWTIGLLWG